ncbi:MAG: 3-hydroxyacyl-CoA dehydrogenase family protein [Microbacteriaceae bacterium]|nr:MAG: 3-hydroxyacyl-CoA dehydrogenase family protein [Microbacteriaceae bacterium]
MSGAAHADGSHPATESVLSGFPVGVLGGGRMGAGIAHAFLLAGASVVVVERNAVEADAARGRIEHAVDVSIERDATAERGGTSLGRGALLAQLDVGTAVERFADRRLVIEAVPEDRALKADALRRVEAALMADAALATNTSSISIDTLAASLELPQRFVGLHFFNPVPASSLVEIVAGSATTPALVSDAQDWVTALGKTPVTVRDSPGFASSRLGLALGLEAIRMLEDGVASAEDIDAAMVLGYKHPIGPLRLTDIVGLDVRLGIAEYLHGELGDRFEPPALLRALVANGKLGRKTGEGFYRWDAP